MNQLRDSFAALSLAGVLGLVSMGCYKATFVDPQQPKAPSTQEEWTDFYLFGLVGEEEIDVRRFCPNGLASIRSGGNVGTDLVTVLTIGIYAPRKIYVTCSASGQQAVLPQAGRSGQ